MSRTLVLPMEFKESLISAHNKESVRELWAQIRVRDVRGMIRRVIGELNRTYPKLNINGYKFEEKETIKVRINNSGNSSVYTGYLQKDGNVDGLFFYIQPSLDTSNDFLSRHLMPTLLGIYENIKDNMIDLHFNNRPVFIVNLNENARSNQRSVKKNFISAELLGFNYLDIFKRDYMDIVREIVQEGTPITEIQTLEQYEILMRHKNENSYFYIEESASEIVLLSNIFVKSKNESAEVYRYFLKVLPAIYMGIENGYSINMDEIDDVDSRHIDTIRSYINKI